MSIRDAYFERLAAAFLRGKRPVDQRHAMLFTKLLDKLSIREKETLIELAWDQELCIHRFNCTMELPRVRVA